MATYRQGDRLSALPDEALERILPHLLSDEATRATALSRRWRRVCEAVPVVDLVDRKTDRRGRRHGPHVCFDSKVTGAIFSKGPTTPIRVLRLHARHPPDDLLDSWIVTAASSGAEEIDLALQYRHYSRRRLCPFGWLGKASADFGEDVRGSYTRTPRQLFRCATLRRLRLANWTLDLPWGVVVAASLETLCLKRIMAPATVLQQLVSSCPHLADLTLEEYPTATEITVSSDRLRSFAMVCCHNARRVVLHTRRLRSLSYKGGLPSDTFLDVPNYGEIAALTIDICEDLTSKTPMEVAPVLELISRCKKLTYLHLAVLVASTLHLEALSLFPMGAETSKKKTYYPEDDYEDSDSEPEPEICEGDDEDDIYDDDWMFRSMWRWGIPCSRHSLKRINITKYCGNGFDRILANFLLSNGAALEEFSVTVAALLSPRREEIAMMFRSWRHNPRTIVTCS